LFFPEFPNLTLSAILKFQKYQFYRLFVSKFPHFPHKHSPTDQSNGIVGFAVSLPKPTIPFDRPPPPNDWLSVKRQTDNFLTTRVQTKDEGVKRKKERTVGRFTGQSTKLNIWLLHIK
jgi:hypothetical protein